MTPRCCQLRQRLCPPGGEAGLSGELAPDKPALLPSRVLIAKEQAQTPRELVGVWAAAGSYFSNMTLNHRADTVLGWGADPGVCNPPALSLQGTFSCIYSRQWG